MWPTKPARLRCLFGTKSEKFFNQEISLSLFEGKNGYISRLSDDFVRGVRSNSCRSRGVSNFLVA